MTRTATTYGFTEGEWYLAANGIDLRQSTDTSVLYADAEPFRCPRCGDTCSNRAECRARRRKTPASS